MSACTARRTALAVAQGFITGEFAKRLFTRAALVVDTVGVAGAGVELKTTARACKCSDASEGYDGSKEVLHGNRMLFKRLHPSITRETP